jgi:hypothetical protein
MQLFRGNYLIYLFNYSLNQAWNQIQLKIESYV